MCTKSKPPWFNVSRQWTDLLPRVGDGSSKQPGILEAPSPPLSVLLFSPALWMPLLIWLFWFPRYGLTYLCCYFFPESPGFYVSLFFSAFQRVTTMNYHMEIIHVQSMWTVSLIQNIIAWILSSLFSLSFLVYQTFFLLLFFTIIVAILGGRKTKTMVTPPRLIRSSHWPLGVSPLHSPAVPSPSIRSVLSYVST